MKFPSLASQPANPATPVIQSCKTDRGRTIFWGSVMDEFTKFKLDRSADKIRGHLKNIVETGRELRQIRAELEARKSTHPHKRSKIDRLIKRIDGDLKGFPYA